MYFFFKVLTVLSYDVCRRVCRLVWRLVTVKQATCVCTHTPCAHHFRTIIWCGNIGTTILSLFVCIILSCAVYERCRQATNLNSAARRSTHSTAHRANSKKEEGVKDHQSEHSLGNVPPVEMPFSICFRDFSFVFGLVLSELSQHQGNWNDLFFLSKSLF